MFYINVVMERTRTSLPYDSLSSSSIIDALCPFGVPQVRSSIPDLPIRPVGLSDEDMLRVVVF